MSHVGSSWKFWGRIVEILSGERLLNSHANGGGVILVRSALSSSVLYLVVLSALSLLDDGIDVNKRIVDTLPWFGAMFAAIYASLYARFASQWTYLANLYNQIKQTELELAKDSVNPGTTNEKLAEWKAAFIEDAQNLHLVRKPIYASVIRSWSQIDKVKQACLRTTCPSSDLDRLLRIVDDTCRNATSEGNTPKPNAAEDLVTLFALGLLAFGLFLAFHESADSAVPGAVTVFAATVLALLMRSISMRREIQWLQRQKHLDDASDKKSASSENK